MADDPKPEPAQTGDKTAKQTEAVVAPAPAEPAPAAPAPAASAPGPAGSLPPPVAVPEPDTGYTLSGVPTFEGVREKIESRYGTSLGATELAEETPAGHNAAQQFEARQKAAEDRLEQIRASMRKPD